MSAEIAKLHAETEFEKYRIIQDRLFMSGFDKYMLELEREREEVAVLPLNFSFPGSSA